MRQQNDKEKARTRITIYDHELEDWGIKKVSEDHIKFWLNAGINSEGDAKFRNQRKANMFKRLDAIEDKLDRLALMLGQYCHQIYVAQASTEQQVESDYNRHKNFHATELLRATGEQLLKSLLIRHEYFPELKIPSFFINADEKREAMAQYFRQFQPQLYRELSEKGQRPSQANQEQATQQ